MDFSFIMLGTTEVICFVVQSIRNFMRVRKVVLKCVRETYLGEDPSAMLEMMRYLLQRVTSGSWYIRRFLVLEYNWIGFCVREDMCRVTQMML